MGNIRIRKRTVRLLEAGIFEIKNKINFKWSRNCPNCNNELIYTNYYNCKIAYESQSLCRSCSQIGIPSSNRKYFSDHIFSRNCPTCNKLLTTKHKTAHWRAEKNNSECRSCSKRGIKNPQINSYGEINVSKRPEVREKLRISYQNQIAKCYGQISPRYNPIACEIFEEINQELNWNGQHAENGGEMNIRGWFLDYYEPNQNVVIEYDEKQHNKTTRREKDKLKEREVVEELGCKFYRIQDGQNWRDVISKSTDQKIMEWTEKFIASQKPLPPEEQAILYNNLKDLYLK